MKNRCAVFSLGIIVLLASLTGFSMTAMAAAFVDVTAAEAKALIDATPGLVIIDVSPVYALGHLPKALNYPVNSGSLSAVLPSMDKKKVYLVYCHTDAATIKGAQKFVDAGFEKVYRLTGNYQGWVDAGYPVEK